MRLLWVTKCVPGQDEEGSICDAMPLLLSSCPGNEVCTSSRCRTDQQDCWEVALPGDTEACLWWKR